MSIRIKSVCLNQPSDSFLYISSFCPPLYSRSIPLIFFSREILRLSSSKVRHIYYIGLYNIILHLQDQVKCHICQKQTFFAVRCQSLSLVGEPPPSAPSAQPPPLSGEAVIILLVFIINFIFFHGTVHFPYKAFVAFFDLLL